MTRGPTSRKTKGVVKSEKTPRKAKKVPCLSLCKPKTPDNIASLFASMSEVVELCRAMRTALNIVETRCREIPLELWPAIEALRQDAEGLRAQIRAFSETKRSEPVPVQELEKPPSAPPAETSEVIKFLTARVSALEHRLEKFDGIYPAVQGILMQAQALE